MRPCVVIGMDESVNRYNTEWLIERHGHRTPREARADAMTSAQAA